MLNREHEKLWIAIESNDIASAEKYLDFNEIDESNLKIPDSLHVADSSMPDVFKQSKTSPQLQISARRRYWQYLNDPFREDYREQKNLDPDSFPDYQPSSEQKENMHELADLLQKSSTDWLEVSELYREMGDFSNSLNALGAHSGRKNKLHASMYNFQSESD